MSSLAPPQQKQPGQQQAQQPVQPGQSPSQTNVPGLPPTALSMQMQSMNDQYANSRQQIMGAQMGGGQYGTGGGLTLQGAGGQGGQGGQAGQYGQMSLQDMAEKLARGYGLNFGRGSLIDQDGNFQSTPDQLAANQAGSSLATTAASMNAVSQAVNQRQTEMQQDKATAALQAGMGQVQSRGRGSLAAMQSGFYQAMAANYTNPNLLPEQADFSFWIQKAGLEEARGTREAERNDLGLGGGAGGGGGGGGGGAGGGGGGGNYGAPNKTNKTYGNSQGATTSGPQGKGDIVKTGPNAGKRPVYKYDPVSKTTSVTWE